MSKKDIDDVLPIVSSLEAFSKRLAETVEILKRTCEGKSYDGSNKSALLLVNGLLEHEYLAASKMRAPLNKVHVALYKNAKANLEEKRRAENEALLASAPKMYQAKKKSSE